MKNVALLISTSVLLLGCAAGPRPVQVTQVCHKVPPLVLDVPERDWQGQMENFLAGTLPMQPDYSLLSAPALQNTTLSNKP